jgi:hypothetical protein
MPVPKKLGGFFAFCLVVCLSVSKPVLVRGWWKVKSWAYPVLNSLNLMINELL